MYTQALLHYGSYISVFTNIYISNMTVSVLMSIRNIVVSMTVPVVY